MFGVLVFLPLTLVVTSGRATLIWRDRAVRGLQAISLVLLVLPLGLTFIAWKSLSESTYQQSQGQFEVLARESEQALLRLFHRTPRGAAARQATESVNQALRELAGQTIEEILFTVQAPGVYRLGLGTDQVRLTLQIDRHGVTVESLEV